MIVLRNKEFSGGAKTFFRHLKRNVGTAISQAKANVGANLNAGDIKRLAVKTTGATNRQMAPKTWEAARATGKHPSFFENQSNVFKTAYKNGFGVTHMGGGMYKV